MKRRQKNEEGYILVSVLGVAFLAVVIVSSIAAITISDLVFNSRVRGAIEARHAAESALDSYYAVLNSNSNMSIEDASAKFRILGSNPTDLNQQPLNTNTFELITGESNGKHISQATPYSSQWFSVNDDGDLYACQDSQLGDDPEMYPCFQMRMVRVFSRAYADTLAVTPVSLAAMSERKEYSIDIVVRHKCLNTTEPDDPQGCVYSRFQQLIRNRDFVRHVVMSETEEIPDTVVDLIGNDALEAEVRQINNNAYANNDYVDGNIHTNASSIYACSDFKLNESASPWFVTATDNASVLRAAASNDFTGFTACSTNPAASGAEGSPFYAISRPAFDLPSRSQDEHGTRLRALAQAEDNSRYVLGSSGSTVSITFSPGTITGMMTAVVDGVSRGTYALPSYGVIFVDGDLTISGTLRGRVTVYASGNIQIGVDGSNDLVYNNRDVTDSKDMLGLLTTKNIVLHCQVTATGECAQKNIDGLLRAGNQAQGGTIYNDRWWDTHATDSANAPALVLNGAMISGYRGTFGAMESNNNGRVSTGWRKEFTLDPRFAHQQPPYMLRDALAPYIRSGMKDLPCEDSICSNNPTVDSSD